MSGLKPILKKLVTRGASPTPPTPRNEDDNSELPPNERFKVISRKIN